MLSAELQAQFKAWSCSHHGSAHLYDTPDPELGRKSSVHVHLEFQLYIPHVAEGLLQDRTVNLQLRINPESGRVSISVETPDMEAP